jgi:hypothetical protein
MQDSSATFTILQPITEDYVDRVMGYLPAAPDLLEAWQVEHRKEGDRES